MAGRRLASGEANCFLEVTCFLMGGERSGPGFRERRNAQLPCSLEFVPPLRAAGWTSPTLHPSPARLGAGRGPCERLRSSARPKCPAPRAAAGPAAGDSGLRAWRAGPSGRGTAPRLRGARIRSGERGAGGALGARPPCAPPRAGRALPRGRPRRAAGLPAPGALGLHRSQRPSGRSRNGPLEPASELRPLFVQP